MEDEAAVDSEVGVAVSEEGVVVVAVAEADNFVVVVAVIVGNSVVDEAAEVYIVVFSSVPMS